MKVVISVTRRTEYSSIVEMSKSEFKRLSNDLEYGDRAARQAAEETLNRLINTEDWVDDSLAHIDDFLPFNPDKD
jgi:hypothetical protein